MKTIILTLIISFTCLTANAAKLNVSHIDNPGTNNNYETPSLDKFSAENDGEYKGRNKGIVSLKTSESLNNSTGISKVVTTQSSRQSAQLDNLETNAGELVQKIEDDKNIISNKQREIYRTSKKELSLAHEYASQIELGHLGQEQDPTVTNAFKCKDFEDCDHKTDVRVIKECKDSEMLHWDGDLWQCIGVFEVPDGPNCNQDQWINNLPGGDKACVDYIYQWGHKAGVCTDGYKTDVTLCYKKKKQSDTGVAIGDDKCHGPKPKEIVTECNANWQIGGWAGCSKSCGGGIQYRSVTCPTGYKCKAAKPTTSQSCNTHLCPTSWRFSAWSACSKSCGGGTQTRSVWCPSGFVCPAAKPTTSQACNTQICTTYWRYDNWGACSKTCGSGNQSRNVWCPAGFACLGEKPVSSQKCNKGSCYSCAHCSSVGGNSSDSYHNCLKSCHSANSGKNCPDSCSFGCCDNGSCAGASGCGNGNASGGGGGR